MLTTEYQYYEVTDRLEREMHSGPIALVPYGNERYYAYAETGGISYRSVDGHKVGPVKAFMMGLPSKMADYLLMLLMVCVPVAFFTPMFSHRRARGERRVKHLLRQGLIILLAYLMLLDPAGLQQLAQASSQYQNISTSDWGTENRTIEYEYDANGSCISKITKETSTGNTVETMTYDYNLRNKLIRTSRAFTDWEGDIVETAEYSYNDDGDRIGIGRYRTVNGGQPEGQDGKTFLIDPYNHTGYSQVLLEYTNWLITTYTNGDDVITYSDDDYGTMHMLYDGHGSTRQLTDSSGDVFYDQVYNYDGYGVRVGYTSEYFDEPLTNLLYAGEYYDNNLRQYNLRARWYDPLNGRFNQIDPYMGNNYDPQSLHKYLYCHANPVNGIDPTGLMGTFTISETVAVQAIEPTIRKIGYTTTLPVMLTAKESIQALITMAIFVYAGFSIISVIGLSGLLREFKEMEDLISPSALNYITQNQAEAKVALSILAAWEAIQQIPNAPTKNNDRYDLPIHLVFEDLTPDIYANTVNALKAHSRWWILNYFGPDSTRREANRKAAWSNPGNGDWTARISGNKNSPDEYPYASTIEGGAGAFVEPVIWKNHQKQGWQLNAFYKSRMKYQPGQFLVVPVPRISFW